MASEREIERMLENKIIKVVNKENKKLQDEIDSLKHRIEELEKRQ